MSVADVTRAEPRGLQLLGTPTPVVVGGAPVRLGQKPLVLLARLLLEPRPITRESMMTFLWPEANEAQARGSLRQALHVLRLAMGADSIVTDRYTIAAALMPDVDLLQFLRAMRERDHHGASLLYGGRLLDGIALADATDAELWLDFERRRLARLFELAATSVLETTPVASVGESRVTIASRFRDMIPHEVRAWRHLLEALAMATAYDAFRMEQAALTARLETGQIADPQAAIALLCLDMHAMASTGRSTAA